ncbi:tRNA pseudouridine(55) synthase TruB [Lacibacter luteus]|uniref:tRNA pseudouridine synthase B n=1 Tax=Lacibacter luteus TaxID=2508719 RepID=A0A4Q1CKX2_9BACT|nr:tRNA pseudouridine(55) synthase TruB [Lacibacter luteus]RXK61606.1 tRNA pseudouridine(55) synthase TruB [Lacibacter luteus]
MKQEEQTIFTEGQVILVDKPLEWTSHDVVAKVRSTIRIKKVGHAGTLDPLATGLLILCTGKFTKRINEYQAREKEYTGTFTIGAVTPTYDLESTPEQEKDYSFVTEELIHETTKPFIGDIMQVPPTHSAIKRDGKPVYLMARKGVDVVLEPRPLHIAAFEITKIELPVLHFRVVCSTGTYIRSLAHDYGKALGCGAYLSSLRRTRIGEFTTEHARTLPETLAWIKEVKAGMMNDE